MSTDELVWGDYGLSHARGRWTGRCLHCDRTTASKHYIGHAEMAVRAHLRDAHHLSSVRRDFRERTYAT